MQDWCRKCSPSPAKQPEKSICAELFENGRKDGDAFPSIIITRGETWVHPYDPSMERHGMSSSFVAVQEKIQCAHFCGQSHGYRLLGQ
jgi:hypothetical protein